MCLLHWRYLLLLLGYYILRNFRTAANTVYTFVDRHRTRAENESNPTDTALAQLYAHIQALPDSNQKRRLIKHFNRQNGYGKLFYIIGSQYYTYLNKIIQYRLT